MDQKPSRETSLVHGRQAGRQRIPQKKPASQPASRRMDGFVERRRRERERERNGSNFKVVLWM